MIQVHAHSLLFLTTLFIRNPLYQIRKRHNDFGV